MTNMTSLYQFDVDDLLRWLPVLYLKYIDYVFAFVHSSFVTTQPSKRPGTYRLCFNQHLTAISNECANFVSFVFKNKNNILPVP